MQINCVYNTGSTGKIVHDIHTELQQQDIDSVVCYGRGVKVHEQKIYKTCGELYSKANNLLTRFTGLMYGGCFFSTKKLIYYIKKEKPDVIHLHCINGYFVNIFRLISFLKHSKIKIVLTLHAEFMHTGNCGHALDCEKWKTGCGHCPRLKKETKSLFFDRTHDSWQKMKAAFNRFNNLTVVSVSPWLMERAKLSPILSDKIHKVVFNGIDTKIFKPYDIQTLKMNLGVNKKKIVLHVTPIFSANPSNIKGGYYVLEIAKILKEQNIKILVAGLYDKSIVPSDNVILLGCINDQRLLAQYYSLADVTLLTSKKETYSMICAESLCCGTPVVGFKAGAPEQISLPEYSAFVEFGDLQCLVKIINEYINKPKNSLQCVIEAHNEYSKENMSFKYYNIYNE